tara:strand:+ start:742 stop:939 length:198 start_codon:yes stop_codon:yes gene_type:complete
MDYVVYKFRKEIFNILEDNKKLLKRIEVLEESLKEIISIASVSEGQAAEFYGMLAKKGLERKEDD